MMRASLYVNSCITVGFGATKQLGMKHACAWGVISVQRDGAVAIDSGVDVAHAITALPMIQDMTAILRASPTTR